MSAGAIILAAGGSTRMGRPKQLLRYEGKTLLRRAVETAVASVCNSIVVVLGAELAAGELDQLPITIVDNAAWETGMGSSIRVGVETLARSGDRVESVVIMLCDQPHVTADLIDRLVATHHATGKRIVACQYGKVRGVPALFDSTLFDELACLEPNEGARRVIAAHTNEVATIPFARGSIDVDTPPDYQRLLASPAIPR
jgi:molybdenum cofactor cytidylyltransferase